MFQFDLGCQNWKRTLIGTIHNSGLFLSLPLTGIISDRYGRKVALSVAALMNCIFGFLRSFSTHYIMMLTFEFLEAGFGAGAYTTAFVFGKTNQRHFFKYFIIVLLYKFESMHRWMFATQSTPEWLNSSQRIIFDYHPGEAGCKS